MSGKKNLLIVLPLLGLLCAIPAIASSKGTMTCQLDGPALLAGETLAPGQYEVSWRSHSPEVDITFVRNGKQFEAHGRLVERDSAPPYDSVLLDKDASGHDVVKEIRMHGKKTAIVIE